MSRWHRDVLVHVILRLGFGTQGKRNEINGGRCHRRRRGGGGECGILFPSLSHTLSIGEEVRLKGGGSGEGAGRTLTVGLIDEVASVWFGRRSAK